MKIYILLIIIGLALIVFGIWMSRRSPSGPVSVEGEVFFFPGSSDDQEGIGPVAKIRLGKEEAEQLWGVIRNGTPVPDQNDSMCAWFRIFFQKGKPILLSLGPSGIARYGNTFVLTRQGIITRDAHILSVDMAVIQKLMQPFYDEYIKQKGIKDEGYRPTDKPVPLGK